MIKNLYYFEEEAKLNISTTSSSKKIIRYIYRDIPLSLYNQIFQLYKRNLEGRIWKLLKPYEFEKIEKEEK
jgi:hypothetical protein